MKFIVVMVMLLREGISFGDTKCAFNFTSIDITVKEHEQINVYFSLNKCSHRRERITIGWMQDSFQLHCVIKSDKPNCQSKRDECCKMSDNNYKFSKKAEHSNSGTWKMWTENGAVAFVNIRVQYEPISTPPGDSLSPEDASSTEDYSSTPTIHDTDTTHDPPKSSTPTMYPPINTIDSIPMSLVLLGINVAVLVVVFGLILLVAASRKGAILRRNSIRRSLSFRLSSARIMQGHRRWRLFSHRNRRRDVCTRKPSNHPLALPEPPVALSPNDYDLINDDHIVVGEDAQGATARPQPCLPRSGYLHPIPAPEDVFGDFKGRGVDETKGATGVSKEAAATPLNCAVRSAYLNPTPSDVDRHQTVQKLTEDAQTLDFTGQGARPKTSWRLTRNNRLDSASPNKAPQSLPVTIPKTPIRLPLRGNCLSFPSNYVRSETWTDHTDQVGHKEEDGDRVEAVPLPPKRPPRKDLLNLNHQNENRLTSLPLCPEIEVKRPDGGIQQSPARPPPRLPSRKGRHQTTKQRQVKEVQKEDVGCQDVPSPCTFKTSEQSSLSAQEMLEVLKRRQKHDFNLA